MVCINDYLRLKYVKKQLYRMEAAGAKMFYEYVNDSTYPGDFTETLQNFTHFPFLVIIHNTSEHFFVKIDVYSASHSHLLHMIEKSCGFCYYF